MTLIQRIKTLSALAAQQTELEGKQAESKRLQLLLDKAQSMTENLGEEVQQLRLLRDEGISSPTDPTKAEAPLKTLTKLLERFTKERSAESLTRRKYWTRLNEQLDETCKSMAASFKTAWHQFVDTAYSGQSPDDLERSLATTDRNIELLKRYNTVHRQLKNLARTRPNERTDFDQVREFARQLSEIYQGFDFNVPEDVKRFLRAVADGGADLDLLTDGVRDWLQEQKTSGHYRIVTRTATK